MNRNNEALKELIKRAKAKNKGLIPYINNRYRCATCGNIGKSHPESSYCFECDSDNWELNTDKQNGPGSQ